jgi:hypothetical protein
MYGFDPRRAAIGGALAAGTGYAAVTGRENMLPTLAVAFLIALVYWPPMTVGAPARAARFRARPADAAIIGFAGTLGVLSLLISLLLPTVADRFDLTGMYEGDFVRVTINDSHEFAFAACVLLALRAVLGVWQRFGSRPERAA